MLANMVILLIIAIIITGASVKLIIDRRKGSPCSGCPYSGLDNRGCKCPDHHS